MAEKKKESVDERILRYIFNSKFYPYLEENAFEFPNPVMDAIADARDYDSARNLILDAVANNPKTLDDLRDISSYYAASYKKDDEMWDPEKTFVVDPKEMLRDINVDNIPLQDVNDKSELIAQVLGYDDGTKGMFQRIPDLLSAMTTDNMKKFVSSEIARKIASEEGANEFERERIKYALGFSPNADDDYVAERLAKYLNRTRVSGDALKNAEENPYRHALGGFFSPNIQAKNEEGKAGNAADILADIAQWGVGGKETKAAMAARNAALNAGTIAEKGIYPLLGPALKAGGASGAIGFAHDLADSLLTKHVYAEAEDGKDISKRGNALDVLFNPGKYLKQAAAGAALAIPLVSAGVVNSVMGATRKKAKSGLDWLTDRVFGNKALKSELDDVQKLKNSRLDEETKKIQDAIDNFTNEKTTANDKLNELYKSLEAQEAERERIVNKIYEKESKGKNVSSEKKQMSAIDNGLENLNKSIQRMERKNKSIDIDLQGLNSQKQTAMQKILEEFDPQIAKLEQQIAQRDAVPTALYYLAALKNSSNNQYEKQGNFSTVGRILGK